MKRKIIIAFAFLSAMISTETLWAQENARSVQKTVANAPRQNEEVSVVRINATNEGCNIVVGNMIAPPWKPSSGLPTGKRMFKPFVITKELGVYAVNNESNEMASSKSKNSSARMTSAQKTAGQPIGGLTVKGGRNPGGNQFNNITVEEGQFTLPSDCPDGEYSMTLSWNWVGSQTNVQKTFKLTMENGVCKGINQAGIK